MFINIVFWLGSDRPSGLLLFVLAVLFSILTPLSCPSSSVSLSYFILAVPMLECLGKHSCMSSQFPIAILNGTSFLSLVQENINVPSGHCYGFIHEVAAKNHLINFFFQNTHSNTSLLHNLLITALVPSTPRLTTLPYIINIQIQKVFYGQEPPSLEYTTT